MGRAQGLVVIAAVGAMVGAAMVWAGPVNPPAGAIAPTGRTLQEIFDKPGGDGRAPIAGGTSAATITQPGSYVLVGDITLASGTAITLAADDVTLDLNGHTVRIGGTSGVGIASVGAHARVCVRNGSVVGGQQGVNLIGMSESLVEDLRVSEVSVIGISVTGDASLPNAVIRRCVVTNIGAGSSTSLPLVSGIRLLSANGVVQECVVDSVQTNNVSGQAIGITQSLGTRVVLERNRVLSCPQGMGTQNSVSVVLRENVVLGSVTAYGNAPLTLDGGGNIPTP